MADVSNTMVKNAQLQFTDSTDVKTDVNLSTVPGAIKMSDGTRLSDWLLGQESLNSKMMINLLKHMATQHLSSAEIGGLITEATYDETTGELVYTKYDGSIKKLNTALNKIAVNFSMVTGDPDNEDEAGKVFLVLKLEDDSEMKVDVTSLVDIYSGSEGEMIVVAIDEGKVVSATLVDASITMDKLATDVQEKITAQYELPIAGDELGGIKNGGNVVVKGDGTADAEVIMLDGDPTILNLTKVSGPDVSCSASIDQSSTLAPAEGSSTVSVPVTVNIVANQGYWASTVVVSGFYRPVATSQIVATENFGNVQQSGTSPGMISDNTTVNVAFDSEITLESGVNYEIYAIVDCYFRKDGESDVSVTTSTARVYKTYTDTTTP